jgi:rod shape-determining protein MreD
MRRILALFLTALLLWAAVALANNALAPLHVTLFAAGLYMTYAALFVPLGDGLAASLLAGAVCDANAPVPFGTHALLFATAHVLIFAYRDRLPGDQPAGRAGVALLANAVLFIALSALQPAAAQPRAWPRLAADLGCSEALVGLAAAWFFALQEKTLSFVPRDPERMF